MTLNLRFSLVAGMAEDMGEGVAGPTVLETLMFKKHFQPSKQGTHSWHLGCLPSQREV